MTSSHAPDTALSRKLIEEAYSMFKGSAEGLDLFEFKYAAEALGLRFNSEDEHRSLFGTQERAQLDFFRSVVEKLNRQCPIEPKETLSSAFEMLDSRKSGTITLEDLRKTSMDLHLSITESELREMMDFVDSNHDGKGNATFSVSHPKVSKHEFINAMLKYQ